MKDGHNPDEETDSEEERIYRNVMEQHKSLQSEDEELMKKIKDLCDKKEKKISPALSKGGKKSKEKKNVIFKTPEKQKYQSENKGQASDSDDVAIIDTPPNKYHLRSSKDLSNEEIPEILQKSPDSPWKSPPKVNPDISKQLHLARK